MNYCELSNRGVVGIGGADAHDFLQGLVTADMDAVETSGAEYGALLTPQGKVLFDFLIVRGPDGYLLDLPKAHRADLVKRLTFYKLRAKVDVSDMTETHVVAAVWDGADAAESGGVSFQDPRHEDLGIRIIGERTSVAPPSGAHTVEPTHYHAHRIAIGVPEASLDFDYGEVFPHDVDMDSLNGVSFGKGCYVGQEVVSRMQHRGTARRRIVKADADGALPAAGTEITANGKTVGTLGSSADTAGLALIRLDRAKGAIDAGTPIEVSGVALRLSIPDWASFGWPETANTDA